MAKEDKDGGYECDLIEEPPDDLVCPICHLPLRKPHLISCCGRKLCHPCVGKVQRARQPCPCCREKQYIIVIDKMVERQVLDLKVYCKNKSKGCPWSGELRDLEKHTESCYVTILAEQKGIIKKQAEDIKKLEKKNKELVRMTKEMQDLLNTKIDQETAMKRSIETLNLENEQLKRQLPLKYQPSEMAKLEHELEQFQLMHDRKIAEKNEVVEHQKEEIETLEGENRKLQDKVEGLSQQETAMKRSIETLNVENEQLKQQLRESLPKYTPTTAPSPPYGPGYIPDSRTVHPPAPQHGARICPVCGLGFPAMTSQQTFEQHVNSHYGN